jgi:hypothetical protein
MLLFVENMLQNPSKRAVDELFDFIEACDLPITEDGCFLAYKKVRGDYMDCRSGSIRNAVGDTPSMERNMVDEDSSRTCSYGLHACSYEYLKHFGGARCMVVKINPKDCVSFPKDYNNSKLRCSGYEVVGEIPLDNGLPTEKLNTTYLIDKQTEKSMDKNTAEKIRADISNGMSVKDCSTKYSLSERQIRRIKNYEAWV